MTMSKKNALAFAIGLGGGYMSAERQAKDEERRVKQDAWEEEDRAWQRQQRDAERRNQITLADAAAPRSAVEGTVVTDGQGNENLYRDPAQAAAARADLQAEAELRGDPDLAPARPGYGVTGTSLGNVITDQKPDVASLNTPQARNQRVVDALMGQDPIKAVTLQNATTAGEKARLDIEEAQRKRRAEIEQEGMVAAVRAAQTGDPVAVKEAFNKSGQFKIEGDLKVTPVKRKAPWGGEVESFDYEGSIVGADGKTRPVKLNSMDAMVRMIPFKDLFETQSKVGLESIKAGNAIREIEARGSEDRRTADHKKATGGDNLSREERLRYTSLFQDAGRRMGEAQRALSTLQKDPLYSLAKPGSPQYGELQALRESIQTFASERSTYQSMLAGSQTQDGPGQVGAPSRSTPSKSPSAWNSPERESDRLTILNSELEKARRAGNTGDVAALEREIANVSGNKPAGQAATNGAPQRVSTRAERDKLPKGTRYIGPDGKTYIKQ